MVGTSRCDVRILPPRDAVPTSARSGESEEIFLHEKVAADKTAIMNWLAILCAAVAYWILGLLWYSAFFGKMWAAGLEQHGVKLQPGGMAPKMIASFIVNLVAAGIMMRLIARTGIADLPHGLKLGAGVGLGFSATAITIQYLWESKPFKVWLIDASYHFFGCILLGAILSVWH
jgi:biotin transporter BioY